jgi:hypothetical protein
MAQQVIVTDLGVEDDGMVITYNHGKGTFELKPVDAVVPTFNAQTGTAYTLVESDIGKYVTMTNAGASTFTVPQDSDASFPIGALVTMHQLGAGQVTVTAGTGATLRVSGLTAKARAQYSVLVVQKIAANTWVVRGDVAAS